jgi:hypothetical protein
MEASSLCPAADVQDPRGREESAPPRQTPGGDERETGRSRSTGLEPEAMKVSPVCQKAVGARFHDRLGRAANGRWGLSLPGQSLTLGDTR